MLKKILPTTCPAVCVIDQRKLKSKARVSEQFLPMRLVKTLCRYDPSLCRGRQPETVLYLCSGRWEPSPLPGVCLGRNVGIFALIAELVWTAAGRKKKKF